MSDRAPLTRWHLAGQMYPDPAGEWVRWDDLLATLDAASKPGLDEVREAAERVLDWADHDQPWNPAGDFDALYAATGRRRPEGEEPVGPRYYAFREKAG